MNHESELQISLRLTRDDFQLEVELDLPRQGITVLFGPSGSGKTTLLRCVAGLERAQGRITVGEEIWQDSLYKRWIPTWQRDLGYVFQEASLFEHMDVQANLHYGLSRVRKTGGNQALKTAISLLGIEHLQHRTIATLSGGERQRVAIARALAIQPRVLLLDEPLASLDIARRHEILPWLERLHHEAKIPMLYVTHNMEELTRLADYVVLLDQGRVKAQGDLTQTLSDPKFARFVAHQAGALLHGIITKRDTNYHLACVDIGGSEIWIRDSGIAIGSDVRVHIHANDVSISLDEPKNTSIQNVIPGVIESMVNDTHAANSLVTIRHQDQLILARTTRKSLEKLGIRPGSPVWLQIKSVALTGH